jgi:hypothetical protein
MPQMRVNGALLANLTPTAQSFLKCIRFRGHVLGRRVSDAFLASVANHISRLEVAFRIGCHDTLNFGDFSNFDTHQELFFQALEKHREFTRVLIPKHRASIGIWGELGQFLSRNKSVKEIECHDTVDDGFDSFIAVLQQSKTLTLEKFHFSGDGYDKKFVDCLFRYVSTHPTCGTISIERGLSEDGCQAFMRFSDIRHITRVSLVEIPWVNVNTLCERIDRLKALNVSRCGFDIADLLTALSRRKDCSLKELNASGNKSVLPLPSVHLPASIGHYIFADVNWQGNNLRALFLLLAADERTNRLRLDISNAQQTRQQWSDFDTFLVTQRGLRVDELVYDGNPTSRNFLAFVAGLSGLTNLSINGCIEVNDEMTSEVCRYLKRNRTLEELHICGSERKVLGASIRQVFDALKFNSQLHVLDIRHQKLSFDLIPMLEDFFTHNKTVDEIFIDDNNLLDIQSFEKFLANLVARNVKLILHVPTRDLLSLFELNNVSSSRAERVARLLHQLKNCQAHKPFSQAAIGLQADKCDPDEVICEIRHSYLEDNRWCESLSFAPMADETVHYELLDNEFALDGLVRKLRD